MTYDTSPPGAMIYEGNKAWGIAPVTITMTAEDYEIAAGYVDDNNMYAVWPSGATTKQRIKIWLRNGNQKFTFSRPSNAPGLDKDLAYATQLRQAKASEEQASSASSASFWQMLQSMDKPKQQTAFTCNTIAGVMNCH